LEFVICGFYMFEQGKLIENAKWVLKTKDNLMEKFFSKQIVLNTQSILWKKKVVSGVRFNENLTRAQDLDFISRALKSCKMKFEVLALNLVYIRQHNDSITSTYKLGNRKDILSEIFVRKSILSDISKDNN